MGGGSVNTASYTMQLIPSSDRDRTTTDIVKALDEDLKYIPSADITVSSMDSGMGFGDPIQLQLSGPEHEVLGELADNVVDEISDIEGIHNADSSAAQGVPQMSIEIDKEKASRSEEHRVGN